MILYRRDYLLFILLGIAFIMWGYYLFLGQNVSVQGIERSRLQKQLDSIEAQNQLLKEEIYIAESYRVIYQKAQKMGFINDSTNVIYLRR